MIDLMQVVALLLAVVAAVLLWIAYHGPKGDQ